MLSGKCSRSIYRTYRPTSCPGRAARRRQDQRELVLAYIISLIGPRSVVRCRDMMPSGVAAADRGSYRKTSQDFDPISLCPAVSANFAGGNARCRAISAYRCSSGGRRLFSCRNNRARDMLAYSPSQTPALFGTVLSARKQASYILICTSRHCVR